MEQWDGRDDSGVAVPPGTYSWKMLSVPGFSAEYLMSPGASYPANQAGPFWAQSPGSHGGPAAVTVDGAGFYVASFGENIETFVLKQSTPGNARVWSALTPEAWFVPSAMASVGQLLWVLGVSGTTVANIHRYDNVTGVKDPVVLNALDGGEQPTDMAVTASAIVLTYPKQGVVRWLNYTGTETRRLSLAGVRSADVAADGTTYFIAGSAVWKLAPGANVVTSFQSGLTSPLRAAVSGTGDLFVVLRGSSNQVQRFAPSGRLLSTYGSAGGRVDGTYQNQKGSFRGATDIAANSVGDFWVTEGEAAPRRTVHFTRTGTWIEEWYGGQVWAPWIVAEPDAPNFVWMPSQWGDIMRLQVNYATQSWTVHSCYTSNGLADGLYPQHSHGESMTAIVHNGTLYLALDGNPVILKVDRVNSKIQAAVVALFDNNAQWSVPWLLKLNGGYHSLLWTDANGDGRPLNADGTPQMAELKLMGGNNPGWIDPSPDVNLNYLFQNWSQERIAKYTVSSWNSVGSPVYGDFPAGSDVTAQPPRMVPNYNSNYSTHLTGDASGSIWGSFNPNVPAADPWNNSADAFVSRYSAGGVLAFSAGHKGTRPGNLRTLRHVFGVVNNSVNSSAIVVGPFATEWPSEGVTPLYAFDQDGLYAGQILGLPVNTTVASWSYNLGAEGLTGSLVKDSSGNVYLLGHWINEARIYKITGWTGWARSNGSATVPVGYAAPAFTSEVTGPNGNGTGLLGKYYTTTDFSTSPVITRVDATLDFMWNAFGTTAGSPTGTANYSVRWAGTLIPRRTGWHMFQQSRNTGASSYWVNNIAWVDNNSPGRAMWLTAGQAVPIRLDWTTSGSHPSAIFGALLQWAEPECNGAFATIPTSQLVPAAP